MNTQSMMMAQSNLAQLIGKNMNLKIKEEFNSTKAAIRKVIEFKANGNRFIVLKKSQLFVYEMVYEDEHKMSSCKVTTE